MVKILFIKIVDKILTIKKNRKMNITKVTVGFQATGADGSLVISKVSFRICRENTIACIDILGESLGNEILKTDENYVKVIVTTIELVLDKPITTVKK